MSEQASAGLEGRTQLVRITNRGWDHGARTHLHRECAGCVPEDSMGVDEVEWATPSGFRRRRRLWS